MVGPIIPPRKHRRYLTDWLLKEDRKVADEHKFKHPLLATAAWIMSFFLLTSSLVTTLLIPPAEFQAGGDCPGLLLHHL